jgi:transposase
MPFLVIIMVWTGVHRSFVVRVYYENNHSVIATLRTFRLHFSISRAESVPSANTIKFWIRSLEETGSTLNGHGNGPPRTVRTPENVQWLKRQLNGHQDALPENTRLLWESRTIL